MALSKTTSLLTAAGLGTGGFSYAITSGRSVAAAVLWGLGVAAVGMLALWLARWSNGKPPSQGSPPR